MLLTLSAYLVATIIWDQPNQPVIPKNILILKKICKGNRKIETNKWQLWAENYSEELKINLSL